MSKDETPVPQPDEADRDDAIHYYEVDETDVSRTHPSRDRDDATDDDDHTRDAGGG